jgi:hypothetical protein
MTGWRQKFALPVLEPPGWEVSRMVSVPKAG